MNTPRSVFKNTVALFAARVGYMVGSILLVFFLSRMLQAEGLGSYSTAMALYGLAELAGELGLSNFIPRELAKDLTKTNRYLMHASVLAVGSAVAAALVLAGLASHLGYSTETVLGIYLIVPALIPSALRVVIGAIFISHQKVKFETFTILFWTILRILLSLYLLRLGHGVISLMVVFAATSYLAMLNSVLFYVRYIGKPRWEFDLAFFWNMVRNLKTFVALALAGSVFAQCETIILSLFKGETQVGFYSAAFRLITVWYLIPQSFMSIVFPVLTQAYQHSIRKSEAIQEKSIKYLLAIALPLSVGGFAAAAPIVDQFYGPGFKESILVFRVIAWHTMLAFVNNVLWRVLLARDEQHLALRVQVIGGLTRIGLSLALVPWLGSLGAAWALMGGYGLYTVLHVYYIQRGGTYIPFLRLGWRFALASTVMGAFILIIGQQLNLILLVLLAGLIYAIMVFLLRAFSQEDWALFRQVWRRGDSARATEPESVPIIN
jgi:O-antigen/teichoic acid export membrane protein